MPLFYALAAVPLLIFVNAFFVAAEYALVAITDVQVEALRATGRRRAADAVTSLKADAASSIGAIQVCITMANLLLGWIGEPAMSQTLLLLLGPLARMLPPTLFAAISTALAFLVVTLLTVVLGELLPKALTLRSVPRIAVLTAETVLRVRTAARPLLWLMNAIANAVTVPLGLGRVQQMEADAPSAQDLLYMTTRAAADGVLTERERQLIANSLTLGRRTARQIMVPRTQVAYLDVRWPMERNRQVMDAHLFSRLPLCDGGMDHVLGIVRTKEFLSAYNESADTAVLGLIALPPVFIPEVLSLDRLLPAFQQHGTQMLFLVDEYGGVEGIVCLRDVVDELFS